MKPSGHRCTNSAYRPTLTAKVTRYRHITAMNRAALGSARNVQRRLIRVRGGGADDEPDRLGQPRVEPDGRLQQVCQAEVEGTRPGTGHHEPTSCVFRSTSVLTSPHGLAWPLHRPRGSDRHRRMPRREVLVVALLPDSGCDTATTLARTQNSSSISSRGRPVTPVERGERGQAVGVVIEVEQGRRSRSARPRATTWGRC